MTYRRGMGNVAYNDYQTEGERSAASSGGGSAPPTYFTQPGTQTEEGGFVFHSPYPHIMPAPPVETETPATETQATEIAPASASGFNFGELLSDKWFWIAVAVAVWLLLKDKGAR